MNDTHTAKVAMNLKLSKNLSRFLEITNRLPPTEKLPLAFARWLFHIQDDVLGGAPIRGSDHETRWISRTNGRPLAIEHYWSKKSYPNKEWPPKFQQSPILYLHGGGWALGNHRSHRKFLSLLAERTSCHVFAPHYQRSPAHSFSESLCDAEIAWHWLWNLIDKPLRQRPILCGDSAGGHLAALLSCQRIVSRRPLFQTLIYPVTSFNFEGHSMAKYQKGFYLTKSLLQWFWKQAIPANMSLTSQNIASFSPMHDPEIQKSPPTLIVLTQNDILFDQGLLYAKRLALHNVRVTTLIMPEMIHGFLNLLGLPESRRCAQSLIDAFLELFAKLGQESSMA